VQSYAVGRGLDIVWTEEGSATFSRISPSLNINFDALGRVSSISGELTPSDVARMSDSHRAG
jgi:hypothetical protein